MASLHLMVPDLPNEIHELRAHVRGFLEDELQQGGFTPRCDSWLSGIEPAFSRRLAGRGWLGMAWPRQYGGHGRSPIERFIVTEELLAAGAPVAAHWVADRQVGPNLMRFGTEAQKRTYLPAIARADCFFCIGMSEPDSGSDLASLRTRAEQVPGGWLVNGSKIWTSGAHIAHAMVALVRTGPAGRDRHAGLSQLIVDMSSDGVKINAIPSLDGGHHFNEVVFHDVFVPDRDVLGQVGNGWQQVTSELAFERSGPERLMSTLPLLLTWCKALREDVPGADPSQLEAVGGLVARCWVLRQMSLAVAAALAAGMTPMIEAAMVKDLGTQFEREVVELARRHVGLEPDRADNGVLCRMIAEAVLHTPAFTLRGGTTEILRRIVSADLERA